jgi:hypothetical protein
MAQNVVIPGITGLGEAVRLIARYYRLKPQALIENYPYPARADSRGSVSLPGSIFAYQFFDTAGSHCASWIVAEESVHVFEKPRKWPAPKENLADLAPFMHDEASA